jgi:hypothetical protein
MSMIVAQNAKFMALEIYTVVVPYAAGKHRSCGGIITGNRFERVATPCIEVKRCSETREENSRHPWAARERTRKSEAERTKKLTANNQAVPNISVAVGCKCVVGRAFPKVHCACPATSPVQRPDYSHRCGKDARLAHTDTMPPRTTGRQVNFPWRFVSE